MSVSVEEQEANRAAAAALLQARDATFKVLAHNDGNLAHAADLLARAAAYANDGLPLMASMLAKSALEALDGFEARSYGTAA